MADPASNGPRKWLWPLLVALLGVLLVIWLLDPSGNEDTGAVTDPIVTGDLADPVVTAPAPLAPTGDAAADAFERPADPAAAPAAQATSAQ